MLATGEIYHILNRGVEDRNIFRTNRDYERFLLTVFECNDINLSPDNEKKNRYRRNSKDFDKNKPQPLVEIFCLCLMPNHFHMAVKQLVDNGIAKFMQRVGNSYTKYFNIKNKRKGSLFMSRYKSVHVGTDSQIKHLITYIHANPLDLIMPGWRLGKIKNSGKAKGFLENYTWSSYPLYAESGGLDFISEILTKDIAKDFYPQKEDYFEAINSWSTRYFENINNLE